MIQGGIFNTNASLNPFASASKVYVGYCSSDGWVGDSTAAHTASVYGFAFGFHGRRILRATLGALHADFGLGAVGARLLLSGCSAGARGAMYNADAVASAAPANVKVQALLDAALWVNVPPLAPEISLAGQCEVAVPLFNASSALNPGCVASLGNASEAYLCLMGQYLLPHLATPYYAYESQFDAFQLPYNLGGEPQVGNQTQMNYCNAWQGDALGVLNTLPAPAQASTSGVFSLTCFKHCLTMGAGFWEIQVQETSLAQAAGDWFFNGENVGTRIMGNCFTFQKCLYC